MRRLDERPGPRLVGPDLPLELDGGHARDRAGRPRGGAAASASRRSSAAGSRLDLAARATGRASRRAAPPATARSARLERRAPSRRRRAATRAWRDDRPGVEALVHPHQRDAGLGVAGQDRRRDRASRRGGAAAATGCRFSAPCRQLEERAPARSGRSRRGRRRSGSSARTSAIGLGVAQARRRQDVRDARARAAAVGDRRRRRAAGARPAGRGGAVTTPTSSTSGCAASAPQDSGRANAPLPRKTVRDRDAAPAAPRPVTPGRSSPRGPPRRPRRRRPTGDQLVHRLEVVDVELAVEVVELVLERAPEQPGPGDLDLLAVAVLGDDPDPLAAGHVRDVARDRQAALEVAVVAGRADDPRVHQLVELALDLDDAGLQRLAELRRGEPDARARRASCGRGRRAARGGTCRSCRRAGPSAAGAGRRA